MQTVELELIPAMLEAAGAETGRGHPERTSEDTVELLALAILIVAAETEYPA